MITYLNFQNFDWVQKNYSLDHATMIYTINGVKADHSQIRVRSMNFGQPWGNPEILDLPYTITIPRKFSIDLINSCLDDLYNDIRQHGVSTNLDEEIVKNGFPSNVSDFISKQAAGNALQYELIRFFEHDLLLRWFGDGSSNEIPSFVINTIDTFQFLEEAIQFEGRCKMGVKVT